MDNVCPWCLEPVADTDDREWESNKYWHAGCLHLSELRGVVRKCPDCGADPGMDCLYDCSSNWKDE